MLRKKLRWPPIAAVTLMAVLAGAEWLSPVQARAAEAPPLLAPATAAPAPVAAPAVPAAPSQSSASADKIENADGQMIGAGNVVINTPNFSLRADKMIQPVTPDGNPSGPLEVSGQVQLTREALRVLARKADLDQKTSAVVAQEIRMGKSPAYVDAATFTLSPGQGELANPTLFFGEPDPFGLNIHANSATYNGTTDDVVMHGATLRLGPVPFFYLPSYTQGHESNPPISLQTHFGYRQDLNAYVRSTTFWTQNPSVEPGLLLDFYGKRGVLAGPALKYNYTANPDWRQDGTLESGYIHDYGPRGLDLNGNPISRDRFFIDWQHQGSLGGQADLTTSLWWWRDSNVLRDFRQDIWRDNQLPDNFVEIDRREQNALFSGFVRFNPSNYAVTQQRMPEVRMDYFASPVWETGIYQEGQVSYVQLNQLNFNGTPTLHSNRFDSYYGWRRPFNIGDWATITPVAGARVTHYMDTLRQQGDFTRMLGQVGFDAEMHALGRWNFDSPMWDINGLQHVVRPVVQYRYIPAAQQGAGLIPVIDADTFSSYPPILDLGDTRSTDQLHSQNVLRYGVENLFQTRADGYGSRDLVAFNVYNDIHFQQAAGQKDLSDVWTQLVVTPASWFRFEAEDRLDPAAFANREVRTRSTISDGDRWSASFTSDSVQHQINQYWVDARYRITERWSVFGRWRYDEHVGGLVEQTYGVRQRLGEVWDIQYGISYYRGTTTQNGLGFNVRFILLVN